MTVISHRLHFNYKSKTPLCVENNINVKPFPFPHSVGVNYTFSLLDGSLRKPMYINFLPLRSRGLIMIHIAELEWLI